MGGGYRAQPGVRVHENHHWQCLVCQDAKSLGKPFPPRRDVGLGGAGPWRGGMSNDNEPRKERARDRRDQHPGFQRTGKDPSRFYGDWGPPGARDGA
eukprot:7203625-Alexandrium_andersonii.AAC.1